jgi:hypothetical protein
MIFLSRIIPLFDEVFMTLDPALMDAQRWNRFRERLMALSIEIFEEDLTIPSGMATVPLERLLVGHGSPSKSGRWFPFKWPTTGTQKRN